VADEDAAVVEAVRSGDAEAFRTLVERHNRRLFGVILRLVGDRDQAEELAQETFVKAYRSLSDFRGEAAFGTWLVQIGIHAARDRLRGARRRRGIVSIEALRESRRPDLEPADRSPSSNPARAVEAAEQRELMRKALADLPPDYREVLVLKHFEEWPYEHIAEVTGDTVGTLKVRAFRARQMLRDRLNELGWEGADGTGSPRAGNDRASRS
jgi:RNA polymerase sigma-70 factor (ECF subfamily)